MIAFIKFILGSMMLQGCTLIAALAILNFIMMGLAIIILICKKWF